VFDLDGFFNHVVKSQGQRQKALIYPPRIDLRNNSTYFLPFNRQSIYSSMMPLSFNFTLMNHVSLHSTIISSYWELNDQQSHPN
jgi:hypothetical protein